MSVEADRAAGVVPAAPWRVEAMQVLSGFRLHLRFRDGTEGTADLSALIAAADAGSFAALRDEAEFAAVCLELGVPTWPNGADLDPSWLYDEIRASGQWSA